MAKRPSKAGIPRKPRKSRPKNPLHKVVSIPVEGMPPTEYDGARPRATVEVGTVHLTPKQARFCEEYMIHLNASHAAILAGYTRASAGEMGYSLLQKPHVQQCLREMEAHRQKRTMITADRILCELANLGLANMLDYLTVEDDGSVVTDLSRLTREKAAAIQEIQVVEYTTGTGSEAKLVKRTKIKLYDKKSPLEMIARHLGMFRDDGPDPAVLGGLDADKRRAARQALLTVLGDAAKPTPATIDESGEDA